MRNALHASGGRLVMGPLLGMIPLLLPVSGADCVSDAVDNAVDEVVAGIVEQNTGGTVVEEPEGDRPTSDGDAGTGESGVGPHIETDGLVVVEAEHYSWARPNWFEMLGQQVELDNRRWYVQDGGASGPGPDPDGFHTGASGDAYLECLPDTRVTHSDPIEDGSLYGEGEGGASLDYEIEFQTAGTYYVWVRAYSTGTEDNGIHVGLDGELPETGRKIQLCGQNEWRWTNAQRGSGGSACGVTGTITITVWNPGPHTVTFHQREDGHEFDRFLLTTDPGYGPTGEGPAESPTRF